MLLTTIYVVLNYLDLDTCARFIDCFANQEELWHIKFNYTYPLYSKKTLPISYYQALHLPRLFHDDEFIPLLVLYISNEIIVDILGEAYYVHDQIYHLLITSQLRTCVYFDHHYEVDIFDTVDLMYINDQQELRNLTIKEGNPTDVLLREHVRYATYDLDLIMVRNSGQIEMFPTDLALNMSENESLYYHETVIHTIQHQLVPWTPIMLRNDIASITGFDYSLVFVTNQGDSYAVHFDHNWDCKDDVWDYLGEKQSYVFRYDKYAVTIGNKCMKVVYPYHVYPLCGKSFGFDKVEYIQGSPLITHREKMYTPIDFIKMQVGEPVRYDLQGHVKFYHE